MATVAIAFLLGATALAADKKKPAEKPKSAEKPKVAAPRNQAADLIKKANRPSLSGVVKITKDERGFVKAKLQSDEGQVYTIVNPGSVEEFDGQKVKVIYGDLKKDAKTKMESIRVEEVQKLAR